MVEDLELERQRVEERNWQRNHELAMRSHDKHYEDGKLNYTSVLDFAVLAMRSVTVISGGAVVVILAFIGALYTANSPDPSNTKMLDLATSLIWPAAIFACGAVIGGVATLLGYITQYFYQEAGRHVSLEWEHPYVCDKPAKAEILKKGVFWHISTVLLILLAYSCLFFGIGLSVWQVLGS